MSNQNTVAFTDQDTRDSWPDEERPCLVDTRRTGPKRWVVAVYRQGDWIEPGTTRVLSKAKQAHRWGYVPRAM